MSRRRVIYGHDDRGRPLAKWEDVPVEAPTYGHMQPAYDMTVERRTATIDELADRAPVAVLEQPVGPTNAERMQASRLRGATRHVEVVAARPHSTPKTAGGQAQPGSRGPGPASTARPPSIPPQEEDPVMAIEPTELAVPTDLELAQGLDAFERLAKASTFAGASRDRYEAAREVFADAMEEFEAAAAALGLGRIPSEIGGASNVTHPLVVVTASAEPVITPDEDTDGGPLDVQRVVLDARQYEGPSPEGMRRRGQAAVECRRAPRWRPEGGRPRARLQGPRVRVDPALRRAPRSAADGGR